jgi:hypothetical protein
MNGTWNSEIGCEAIVRDHYCPQQKVGSTESN